MNTNSFWPDLPLAAWTDTCETLHRWTQIAGKVRIKSTPAGQSLVECDIPSEFARARRPGQYLSGPQLRYRLRFCRSSRSHRDQRRHGREFRAGADVGRRLLRRIHAAPAPSRYRRPHLDDAFRNRECGAVRARSRACPIRSRICIALSPDHRSEHPRDERIPRPLHRQSRARCISSGAVSISRSRVSPAAPRPRPKALPPTSPAG